MNESNVVNLQRKTSLDVKVFQSFQAALSSDVVEAAEARFTIAFISDRRMKELNKDFRGMDTTTDVLSFRHEPDQFDPDHDNLGDIVISVEQALNQAKENALPLETEIKQLILHGLLHLCGYDHETDDGEMNARELQLREHLRISR
ncbi:MAG: rRNA maturation RNase YbeY [Pyrinomonadaceae bacterium]